MLPNTAVHLLNCQIHTRFKDFTTKSKSLRIISSSYFTNVARRKFKITLFCLHYISDRPNAVTALIESKNTELRLLKQQSVHSLHP